MSSWEGLDGARFGHSVRFMQQVLVSASSIKAQKENISLAPPLDGRDPQTKIETVLQLKLHKLTPNRPGSTT
jgi:hypothetical protein